MQANTLKPFGIVLFMLGSLATVAHSQEKEWRDLFNGKNLEGWEFRGKEADNAPKFTVEEGAIVGRTVMPYNPTAFVGTVEQFKDFELLFEVKVEDDLNSGVQVRSTKTGAVKGPQVELQNDSGKTGYLYGQGGGGWLSEDIPKEKGDAYKDGEWNKFRVLVKGNNIKTWINDVAHTDLTSDKIPAEGVIALQIHGYPRGKNREAGAKKVLATSWKNIKIRIIK